MDEFSEIIKAEYGNFSERNEANLLGFFNMLETLEQRSITTEQKDKALEVIESMMQVLISTARRIAEST